ncbi:helix-turn-helix domain-containing protein [Actinoplanes sp. NPDC051851]|uniref:PucR family transcriptional regulator n=1 Tax=Actinoplanes sp. NPDC051851 TaxID=3154753 RepID=UPI00343B312A
MHRTRNHVRDLAAAVHRQQDAIGARFAPRLREVVPEYYAVAASDFQAAGWEALSAVIEDALLAMTDDPAVAGLPREVVAESAAAARNGLSWESLDRSYRLTHQVLWETVITELAALKLARADDSLVLRAVSDRLFTYFDRLSTGAGEVYARVRLEQRDERDQRIRRLVEQVLDGVAVPEAELGYRLAGTHVAVVARGAENLRDTVAAACRTLGAASLIVQAGEGETWAWLAIVAGQDAEAVRGTFAGLGAGRFALGAPAGGRDGFAAGHRQARLAASLWARKLVAPVDAVVAYEDVALLAVALENESTARAFADHELRRLNGADARSAELRETLVVYARAGLNAQVAARTLGIAERTVRHRLAKLEETLGAAFRSRMPELVLAVSLHEAAATQRRALEAHQSDGQR